MKETFICILDEEGKRIRRRKEGCLTSLAQYEEGQKQNLASK